MVHFIIDNEIYIVALLSRGYHIQVMPLNKFWHDYNESLIERGRILMDIGWIFEIME